MVYQVGRPAMLDGKRFLPDTGMPIWKSDRMRIRLAVWLPEPLTVATWMLNSLAVRCADSGVDRTAESVVAMKIPNGARGGFPRACRRSSYPVDYIRRARGFVTGEGRL